MQEQSLDRVVAFGWSTPIGRDADLHPPVGGHDGVDTESDVQYVVSRKQQSVAGSGSEVISALRMIPQLGVSAQLQLAMHAVRPFDAAIGQSMTRLSIQQRLRERRAESTKNRQVGVCKLVCWLLSRLPDVSQIEGTWTGQRQDRARSPYGGAIVFTSIPEG